MTDAPDIVIGSGPSGVSVAKARLAKGKRVLMLDAGKELEPGNQSLKATLASQNLDEWSADTLIRYKDGQINAPEGAIRKFGSDFAVEPRDNTFQDTPNWLGLRASHAAGGLSNVWGASVLPSAAQDMTDWPIAPEDLAEHYRAIAAFMPISGRTDAIERLYPAFPMDQQSPLTSTPQAEAILNRSDAKGGQLGEVTIGAARNAAQTACQSCGLCLHGCPYGHIWSAAQTLKDLQEHPNFSYQMGTAQHLSEVGDQATVTLKTGQTVQGTRIFVATGVLETAKLYLSSFSGLTQLTLLDSQHFFTPFLHHWTPTSDPEKTPHHTLTGAFAEFETPGTNRLTHSQLYTWNDQYKREMVAKYGRKLPFGGPLFEMMSKRLIVAQSFLHSDQSGKIGLRLNQTNDRLIPENISNPKTAEIVKSARQKLAKGLRKIGLHALSFAGHSGAPGSSFHVGGSLPMAKTPTDAQTDTIGRLKNHQRIHAVDASLMSSVPASTITFTVMANAHRIGTLID